ncbi:MAG: NAD(P)-dependent oxidoreductase [bacterium]
MRVLIASSIDERAITKMREKHDVTCHFNATAEILKEVIPDREVLIFRSGVHIAADIMACAPELKLIIRAGCGLDNVDVEYARGRGIELHTIPQPASFSVSEMTFALMLGVARRILEADESRRAGHWIKNQLNGRLLHGKTLGIIGMGNIGSRVGQLGVSFGMRVLGCVEHPSPARAEAFKLKNLELTTFERVVSEADFLTVHVPRKASTRNLVNAGALAKMKQDSILVNIARGGVLDEKALYHELTHGTRLLGAALDVHEQEGEGKLSPFREMKNVILTPHIGSMTVDTYKDMGQRIVKIFDDFVEKSESRSAQETLIAG